MPESEDGEVGKERYGNSQRRCRKCPLQGHRWVAFAPLGVRSRPGPGPKIRALESLEILQGTGRAGPNTARPAPSRYLRHHEPPPEEAHAQQYRQPNAE
jgi:hypothetical protein